MDWMDKNPDGEYVRYEDVQKLLESHARLVKALKNQLRWSEIKDCTHEETHRGGSIWTICDSCGMQWADDRGGFPGYIEPKEFEQSREVLNTAKQLLK